MPEKTGVSLVSCVLPKRACLSGDEGSLSHRAADVQREDGHVAGHPPVCSVTLSFDVLQCIFKSEPFQFQFSCFRVFVHDVIHA